MDQSLTFHPSLKLKIYRSCWELGRVVPVILTAAIAAGVLSVLDMLAIDAGYPAAAVVEPPVPWPRRVPSQPNGCSWAASVPGNTRCEFVHLAQRDRGHLHRNGHRTLVRRVGRSRHTRAGVVATCTRCPDRIRRLPRGRGECVAGARVRVDVVLAVASGEQSDLSDPLRCMSWRPRRRTAGRHVHRKARDLAGGDGAMHGRGKGDGMSAYSEGPEHPEGSGPSVFRATGRDRPAGPARGAALGRRRGRRGRCGRRRWFR